MTIKNQGFFRKVRLCLWLFFGLGLYGCSVFKQDHEPPSGLKYYRLSGDLMPGYGESELLTILDGTAIINIEHLCYTAGFREMPEPYALSVRVNDETALQRVISRLQNAGFRIRNAALQN